MLTNGIVPYVRSVVTLFVLVLAGLSSSPLRAAATTYDNPASHPGTAVDRLLLVSVSEQGWQPVNEPVGVQSLVYTPEGGQESDDFNTVARHRGFRKFFLLVFICGAVIRFFTSPTFVTFITDALDPKSW
jgi:hypothetical protein